MTSYVDVCGGNEMTIEPSELDKRISDVLESMHNKCVFGWIKNDGKIHSMPTHANGDSCITEARTAIKSIITEARIDELKKIRVVKKGLNWTAFVKIYADNRIAELQADTKDLL